MQVKKYYLCDRIIQNSIWIQVSDELTCADANDTSSWYLICGCGGIG